MRGPLVPAKTIRTSKGMRDTLFDALDNLLNKNITPAEAQAICKICAQAINSVNTEIEYYKHVVRANDARTPPDTTLVLGTTVDDSDG